MNNYEYLIIFILKISQQTPFSTNYYDDVIDAGVVLLVLKDVFIIKEQLCKSV